MLQNFRSLEVLNPLGKMTSRSPFRSAWRFAPARFLPRRVLGSKSTSLKLKANIDDTVTKLNLLSEFAPRLRAVDFWVKTDEGRWFENETHPGPWFIASNSELGQWDMLEQRRWSASCFKSQ